MDQRNNTCISALKARLNLEEVWWYLVWFQLQVQDLLSGYTVKLIQLYTKRYCWNMLNLIWEWQLINQLYLCKIMLCHTMKSVNTFLSEEDITVMEWLAQSPDMNPIENVWKILNERGKEKNPRNVKELWTNLKGEWEKISVDEYITLIRSCSKRCRAVIESKGLHIKY